MCVGGKGPVINYWQGEAGGYKTVKGGGVAFLPLRKEGQNRFSHAEEGLGHNKFWGSFKMRDLSLYSTRT